MFIGQASSPRTFNFSQFYYDIFARNLTLRCRDTIESTTKIMTSWRYKEKQANMTTAHHHCYVFISY